MLSLAQDFKNLVESLTFIISQKVTNHEYASFRDKARALYIGPSLCTSDASADAKNAPRIDAYAFVGPFVVCMLFTALGLIVSFVEYRKLPTVALGCRL